MPSLCCQSLDNKATDYLRQGAANSSHEDKILNTLRFVGASVLYEIYSALLFQHKNSSREYANKQVWFCFNKTLGMLKSEFHTICIYYSILLIFFFFPTILKCRNHSQSSGHTETIRSPDGAHGLQLLTPELRSGTDSRPCGKQARLKSIWSRLKCVAAFSVRVLCLEK